MSLFNDISNALANRSGLTGTIKTAAGGAISSATTSVFGSGPLGKAAASVLTGQATAAFNRLTHGYTRQVNGVAGAIGHVLSGDLQGAAMDVLDSNLIPGTFGLGANALLRSRPLKLMGGISMAEAQAVASEIALTDYARKNYFLLELEGIDGDFSERINFFALDVDYAPVTISGEKIPIGSGHVDTVNSGDPVEVRITTLDDAQGTLKGWFDAHGGLCVHQDGTVGLPSDYAVRISVLHSTLSPNAGYRYKGWFRPANIEHSLSRRESGLEETTLTFAQIDTFFDGA